MVPVLASARGKERRKKETQAANTRNLEKFLVGLRRDMASARLFLERVFWRGGRSLSLAVQMRTSIGFASLRII
jgi:hypothetical protein